MGMPWSMHTCNLSCNWGRCRHFETNTRPVCRKMEKKKKKPLTCHFYRVFPSSQSHPNFSQCISCLWPSLSLPPPLPLNLQIYRPTKCCKQILSLIARILLLKDLWTPISKVPYYPKSIFKGWSIPSRSPNYATSGGSFYSTTEFESESESESDSKLGSDNPSCLQRGSLPRLPRGNM